MTYHQHRENIPRRAELDATSRTGTISLIIIVDTTFLHAQSSQTNAKQCKFAPNHIGNSRFQLPSQIHIKHINRRFLESIFRYDTFCRSVFFPLLFLSTATTSHELKERAKSPPRRPQPSEWQPPVNSTSCPFWGLSFSSFSCDAWVQVGFGGGPVSPISWFAGFQFLGHFTFCA